MPPHTALILHLLDAAQNAEQGLQQPVKLNSVPLLRTLLNVAWALSCLLAFS